MTDLSAQRAHRDYVNGVLFYYEQNDIQPGDPNEGVWHKAHYPVPRCKGGTETIWLLKEHHAVQGVLQSEEFECRTFAMWEKKYLNDELLPIFYKWEREHGRLSGLKGGKTTWQRHKGIGSLSVRWEESAMPCIAINHNTGEVIEFATASDAAEVIGHSHNLLNGCWRESGGWIMRHLDEWNDLSMEEQEEQINEAHEWANDIEVQRRRNGRPTYIYDTSGCRTLYKSVKKACETLGLTGNHLRRTLELNQRGEYRYHKGYRMEYADES